MNITHTLNERAGRTWPSASKLMLMGNRTAYGSFIRIEGNWNYAAASLSCITGCPAGVVFFAGLLGD